MLDEQIFRMGPMLLLAGLSAGWLTEAFVRPRGYGLLVDMALGVGASLVGGGVLEALRGPATGMLAMFSAGLLLATSAIIGQRFFRAALPGARERDARLPLLESSRPVARQASASGVLEVGDGRAGQ